ncbi:hypothetical protein DPMN_007159 [Dreissena polymorpha]|uniref:Uncharacterized protein n=1 Tax=Dreissena polymorpha TaxID=45954 RepID=A0A9D4MTU1_DREPO|nr:hypothetical protein DPMN_007159 [Dreissena polymorpha]
MEVDDKKQQKSEDSKSYASEGASPLFPRSPSQETAINVDAFTPYSEQDNTGSDFADFVLLTNEEVLQLDQRLQELSDQARRHKDDHDKWEINVNTRKLKISGRLQALSRRHRDRLELYEKMREYIRSTQSRQSSR